MSNIELTEISAPGLGTGSYGTNIKAQFDNIDINFKRIVQGEYLKGQSGDIVMLEEIDLSANQSGDALQIKNSFLGYIKDLGLGLSPNGIGGINSQKLYMIYTKNEETEDKVYKSSLPYTFLDPRFNPLSDSAKDEGLEDKSRIIIYDEKEGFKSYNAFPNIYFEGDENEFCWKINGQKTLLPARGPKGDTGYTGAVYILSTNLPSDYDPQKPQYARVNFLITPAEYEGWTKPNISGSVVEKLKGQAAFVYANVKDNNGNNKQYIYISQIEASVESGNTYAVCHLDESCEIHHFFANQTFKDVLTEVKPGSDFNYLFIPSKFTNSKLDEAHVVTTKRSGDIIPAPRPGYWWDGYSQDNWNNLADPNVCIISPATIGSTTRTLKDLSGTLYNNYKTSICPGDAYFGRVATKEVIIDGGLKTGSISPNTSNTDRNVIQFFAGTGNTGNAYPTYWNFLFSGQGLTDSDSKSRSGLIIGPIDSNALGTGDYQMHMYTPDGTLHIGNYNSIGSTKAYADVWANDIRVFEHMYVFCDTEIEGNVDITGNVEITGNASIGELESLNYKVPSLILPRTYNLNNPANSTHSVYLTWNVQDTDRDIPTIAPGQGNKNFLQAGKPKYIINTTELTGISHNTGSTKIHLTFDMSKDWPPTQIEWNFGRTPETISFANGKVEIYTDFKINTGENADNSIKVQNGTSGIDFTNYTGDLNKITSILLTPYDAASVPDCKAYKLTFENASAFSYIDEITGVEDRLYTQLSELRAEIANDYMPKTTKFNWGDIEGAPEIPVLAMDNDNITIQSGNNSFVFPTNINNRIQDQIDSTLSSKDYVTKGTKFSWGDIEGAPEIPEFDIDGDTVTLKAGKSSITLPANIQTAIRSEVDLTLTSKNFVSKDTLTMMGGFNSSNSGTNSNDTEPAIQLMNKQAEGYTITDFCSIIVKYLEGNQEVSRDKYLQWPIKGNVIRGVYHPSEPAGTLSMMVTVGKKSTVEIDGITATVDRITIDGRDPSYGLGCSYGVTKTVPWEVKLVGTTNFKTTVSGYVTLTYTD